MFFQLDRNRARKARLVRKTSVFDDAKVDKEWVGWFHGLCEVGFSDFALQTKKEGSGPGRPVCIIFETSDGLLMTPSSFRHEIHFLDSPSERGDISIGAMSS